MTIEELRAMCEGDGEFHVTVAWRARSGHVLPGARIDLCCECCGERIALNPVSLKMIGEGASRVCRECFKAASGLPVLPPGDDGGLLRSPRSRDGEAKP